MSDTLAIIKQQVSENPVVLYMKGTPQFPQCGFSARAVHVLKECDVDFFYVDILTNQEIRQVMPQYANWPTFPQLYIRGNLIGGSDIITELYQQGELQKLLAE